MKRRRRERERLSRESRAQRLDDGPRRSPTDPSSTFTRSLTLPSWLPRARRLWLDQLHINSLSSLPQRAPLPIIICSTYLRHATNTLHFLLLRHSPQHLPQLLSYVFPRLRPRLQIPSQEPLAHLFCFSQFVPLLLVHILIQQLTQLVRRQQKASSMISLLFPAKRDL